MSKEKAKSNSKCITCNEDLVPANNGHPGQRICARCTLGRMRMLERAFIYTGQILGPNPSACQENECDGCKTEMEEAFFAVKSALEKDQLDYEDDIDILVRHLTDIASMGCENGDEDCSRKKKDLNSMCRSCKATSYMIAPRETDAGRREVSGHKEKREE